MLGSGSSSTTKRSWKWMDGKMVVWPPFESSKDKKRSSVEVTVEMD